METLRYFAGGNTADGFVSHFDDILPQRELRRAYYLKGGPGVGKSTLMRRVAERAEADGQRVEYFHCSSDPDSLDGVALPDRGVLLMDGTAPHVYDPALPAARDTLLPLGDYLDETALRPRMDEIAQKQREISERFRRCYHYLSAARSLCGAAAHGAESAPKCERLAARLCDTLPLRGGEGTIRTLFASAYTPKGLIDLSAAYPFERRFALSCPMGLHATDLWRAIAVRAASRGLDAVLLCDPLSPRELAGVGVPACGAWFWAQRETEPEQRDAPPASPATEAADANEAFDLRDFSRAERRYDQNACELMLRRAVEQLAAAKAAHDELERFYVRCMDFDRWGKALERVTREVLGQV